MSPERDPGTVSEMRPWRCVLQHARGASHATGRRGFASHTQTTAGVVSACDSPGQKLVCIPVCNLGKAKV